MTLEESAVAHLRGAVHRVLPSVRTDLDALSQHLETHTPWGAGSR